MGNKQASHKEQFQRSAHYDSLSSLYKELAEVKDGSSTLKKETFQNYFRSKVDDFDELLFSYISSTGGSNRDALELTNVQFVSGFEKFLDRGGSVEGKVELYFAIFSDGEPAMSFTDVVEMFHISRSLAVALSSTIEGPMPVETDQTIADVWARSIMGEEGAQLVDCDRFCGWAEQNCPRVFDGIHYWMIKMLLYRGHSPGTVPQGFHGIPCIKEQLDNNSLLTTETLWILSTILPSCFIGNVTQGSNIADHQKINSDERKPLENRKEWGLLYDSQEHGQSLNRFKHHCLAYNGPTVTLLRIEKEELLVIAVDVEWRESSSSWGNSDCRIVQIRPRFRVLRAGPNLIFFNERARGLPSGIVLGQTSRPCITLDTGLTSAKLHYQSNLSPQTVKKIEVWGCGGKGLKENQAKQQQWERKQAEKLQKVKRPGRWDDNPDKAILEMAGVTTSHSQRYQFQ